MVFWLLLFICMIQFAIIMGLILKGTNSVSDSIEALQQEHYNLRAANSIAVDIVMNRYIDILYDASVVDLIKEDINELTWYNLDRLSQE